MNTMGRSPRAVGTAVLLTLLALVYSPSAFAVWTWEEAGAACNPDAGSDVGTLPLPQAMLMLDRSGSMGPGDENGTDIEVTECDCDFSGAYHHECTFASGTDFCELEWDYDHDWHDFDSDRRFQCSSCRSAADCVAEVDTILEPWVKRRYDARGYCGSNDVSATYSADETISGTFSCVDCDTDAACMSEADRKFAETFSDYTVDSATFVSGSCHTATTTKWEIAKRSIRAVTQDMTSADPDQVEFGLGLFYGSGASIELEAGPDQSDDISSILGSETPGSYTPMAAAIDTMRASNTIQGAPGGAAGVLITDGIPHPETEEHNDDTVRAACDHRGAAPLYVVGFGAGTEEDFNNVLAAAGGTGSCTGGDPCASGSNQYNASYWSGQCTGSYQADDEQGLINALSVISSEISCTFDLSSFGVSGTPWDDPAQGCAADDYECLDITLGGTNRVHHMSYGGTGAIGWEFASSAHNSIRLLNTSDGASADYCTQIRNGDVSNPTGNDVSIGLACLCEMETGDTCSGESFCHDDPQGPDCSNRTQDCQCPVGTWTCSQGIDQCQRNNPCGQPLQGEGDACTNGVGECEATGTLSCATGAPVCDAIPGAPEPEMCDGLDNDCGGAADEANDADDNEPGGLNYGGLCHVEHGQDSAAIAAETNRCMLGRFVCESGEGGCIAFEKMPEVCNGIDDDCNGDIDNLSTSWSDPDFAQRQLSGRYDQAACFERDVCSCHGTGKDDVEGAAYDAYLEAWANNTAGTPNPTCECGESLSP